MQMRTDGRSSGRPDPGASRTRAQRRHARQTQIIDEAARLFARNGYAATGVTELCEAVGLGRGSLYHYIGSKEALLVQIHDRVMDDVLKSADDVLSLNVPPSQALRMMGVELIRILALYPDHVWVFLHEWCSLTGERLAEFRRRRDLYGNAVERVLREGVEQGEFHIEDIRLTALAWHNLHNFTYQWLRPDGELSPLQIANRFYDVFMHGIAASAEAPRHHGTAGPDRAHMDLPPSCDA